MVDLSTLRGLDLPRRVATRGFQGLPADVREELVDELVGLDQNLREVANRIQDQVAHTHSASDITSGEFNIARIPDIPETKVTDGLDPRPPGGDGDDHGHLDVQQPDRGPGSRHLDRGCDQLHPARRRAHGHRHRRDSRVVSGQLGQRPGPGRRSQLEHTLMASLDAVGAQLGKSGEVSLNAVVDDGYTRTFAADDYLRVNPFEVQAGNADDPRAPRTRSTPGRATTTTSSRPATSSRRRVGTGKWTSPSTSGRLLEGPGDPRPAVLRQGHGRGDHQRDGALGEPVRLTRHQPLDRGRDERHDLRAHGERGRRGRSEARVRRLRHRHENTDALAYDYAAGQDPLIGAGRGVALVVFGGNPGPLSAVQLTDPDSCTIGDNVDIEISFNMEGTSTAASRSE